MGLLSWIFGSRVRECASLLGNEAYDFEIVGESHYQKELAKAAGGRKRDGVEKYVQVWLQPEPKNQHDRNAVRVVLDGRTVGYLPRKIAPQYQKRMRKLGYSGTALCRAVICGGWNRGDGDIGHFGLKLDLEWPVEIDAEAGG